MSLKPFDQILRHKGDILFDLDNTLFPQIEFDLGVYREIADKYEQYADFNTILNYLLDNRKIDNAVNNYLFNDLCQGFNIPLNEVENIMDIYSNHQGDCIKNCIFWDAIEKYTNRYRAFIVTNGRKSIQKIKVDKLGLGPFITETVFCEINGQFPLKPSPLSYEYLNNKYRLNNPLMVGDSKIIDGEYAKNSAMEFIRFDINEKDR